jgi:predicted lipoprotein
MTIKVDVLVAVSVAALVLGVSGCKIKKNEAASAKASGQLEIFFDSSDFNAEKVVADIWTPKVEPFMRDKAHGFAEVQSALAKDARSAGPQYGYSENPAQNPYSFIVRLDGQVVDSNTKSRAAYIAVDTNGDGKSDARVQLGPVIRGTALRDVLPFIPFSAFKNQIEYANVGRALNTQVYETKLSKLDRDNLVGKHVSVTGAFVAPSAGAEILIAPSDVTIAGGQP